ncbi:MAG: hypothetical protein JRH18_01025 [Deltaproteobacteria bacterium]|nr:hypothetical protein [Deltaproteobacteria bacterium]
MKHKSKRYSSLYRIIIPSIRCVCTGRVRPAHSGCMLAQTPPTASAIYRKTL